MQESFAGIQGTAEDPSVDLKEMHVDYLFAGSGMLRDMICREGWGVGRRHVCTLMSRTGIEALYRKPNTGKKHPGHKS